MKKFAVILGWSHNIPCAEKEIIERLRVVSKNIGVEMIMANEKGFILDNAHLPTQAKIGDVKELAFALHTHFSTLKWDDVFSFFPIWNPVSFLFTWVGINYYTFAYLSYDDYLSADAGNPNKHLNHLLGKVGRSFDNSIFLFLTSSKDDVIAPNFLKSKAKLFYCGTAWERTAGMPIRHQNLFKKLDQTNILEIYGPKVVKGDGTFPAFSPWGEYKSYLGEIPFDGKSIFKKINQAGIVLALSSLEHQKAGIMTARIFEAAASGAVIITDKNNFAQKYFGDSVLMVENSGDWEQTAEQIIDAHNWILKNKERAQEMALKAQEIYKKNFLMEQHLSGMFERLHERKAILASQVFAQNTDEQIDLILRWDKFSLEEFKDAIEQINKQVYKNIRVIVVLDRLLITAAKKIIDNTLGKDIEYTIVPMKIFNPDEIRHSPLFRITTTGQMLAEAMKHIKNEYIAFIKSNDIWFSDHLTTLKRVLENFPDSTLSHASLASRVVFKNKTDYCDDHYFPLSIDKVTEYNIRYSDSLIMVRKSLLNQIDSDMLIYMDYLDFHFLALQGLKTENNVKFSYRKTALKTYYIDQPEENPQDFTIVQYKSQKEYVNSLMQFDIPMEKLMVKPSGQQMITQQIISSPMTVNRFSVLFFKLMHRGLVLYSPARFIPYFRKRMP